MPPDGEPRVADIARPRRDGLQAAACNGQPAMQGPSFTTGAIACSFADAQSAGKAAPSEGIADIVTLAAASFGRSRPRTLSSCCGVGSPIASLRLAGARIEAKRLVDRRQS